MHTGKRRRSCPGGRCAPPSHRSATVKAKRPRPRRGRPPPNSRPYAHAAGHPRGDTVAALKPQLGSQPSARYSDFSVGSGQTVLCCIITSDKTHESGKGFRRGLHATSRPVAGRPRRVSRTALPSASSSARNTPSCWRTRRRRRRRTPFLRRGRFQTRRRWGSQSCRPTNLRAAATTRAAPTWAVRSGAAANRPHLIG